SRTKRVISSIEVTFFHGIGAVCVTHHPGLSVTYPAGSYLHYPFFTTPLSFLGLGLRPPVVSWGVMLQDCMNVQLIADYPWLLTPVSAIIITVMSFNFLGDALRDAADPYGN
ncbi:MAG: hypothetical protein ACREIA_22830, partial [Opitutaceae bacterium]